MNKNQVRNKNKSARKINSEAAWKKRYKELSKFFSIHKHSAVPCKSKDDPSLGRWVHKQRSSKEKLNRNQVKLLNELNFVWQEDIRKEKNRYWILMFRKLEKFKGQNGDCNVPSRYPPDKPLGRWVEVLRTRKKHLEEWKMKKLKAIGFQWSEDLQLAKMKRWYEMYHRLEKFYQKYGHSNVPEYWEKDKELSIWVICQRRPKKPLSKQKIKLLNELNFAWNNAGIKRMIDKQGKFVSAVR